MRVLLEILLWLALGLIVWTQLGYALALAAADRVLRPRPRDGGVARDASRNPSPSPSLPLPAVSLIVAAHDEERSIASKVADALALDYPRELLEVIVACDGCGDATARRAREAGADVVLELPRGGKIRAQDAAVTRARGEIVAFSDANALWEPGALRALVAVFLGGEGEGGRHVQDRGGRARGGFGSRLGAGGRRGPRKGVGYACGQVRFVQAARGYGATNQEGVYWRYEMAIRGLESRLSSITAGNGAIYATLRGSYLVVDPVMGHDLSFPFNLVKRGWRAVYVPSARATEPMVPSLEGELARKRRMMSHTWPIVLRGGLLDPRGYPAGYGLMILSHRVLRYATPFLHALALAANVALVAGGAAPRALYVATLALQLGLLFLAGIGGVVHWRPLLVARYYVLTTAAIALGLWDWLVHGTSAAWEAAEGTRPAADASGSVRGGSSAEHGRDSAGHGRDSAGHGRDSAGHGRDSAEHGRENAAR